MRAIDLFRVRFKRPQLDDSALSLESKKEQIDILIEVCELRLKSITLVEEIGCIQDALLLLKHFMIDVTNLMLCLNDSEPVTDISQAGAVIGQLTDIGVKQYMVNHMNLFMRSEKEMLDNKEINQLSDFARDYFKFIKRKALLKKKTVLRTAVDDYKIRRQFQLTFFPVIIILVLFFFIKSVHYFDRPLTSNQIQYGNFIKEWLILGKISSPYRESFDIDFLSEYGGESKIVPQAGMKYKLKDGSIIYWVKHHSNEDIINFKQIFKDCESAVAYAYCKIESPQTQEVVFGMGSDDAIKVWLNGELVHKKYKIRGAKPDQDKVNVQLKKGMNNVLIKVTQDIGGWKFCFRILKK